MKKSIRPPEALIELTETKMEKAAKGLHLAKRYWLEKILPFIRNRKLRGAEMYVAEHGYKNLRSALEAYRASGGTDANHQIDFSKPDFQPPEPLYSDGLKPGELASIAAARLPKSPRGLPTIEAISTAHSLLISAEQYIKSLPSKPKPGAEKTQEIFHLAYTQVSVKEISESNQPTSGRLPFLPSMIGPGTKRGEKVQSQRAIKLALREFLSPDASSIENLERGFVFACEIARIRWERFVRQSKSHHTSAVKRERSKRDKSR